MSDFFISEKYKAGYGQAGVTGFGVRRGKAALSQWVKVPPG